MDIFSYSSTVVNQYAALDPMTATGYGIAGHDGAWTDLSPAGHQERNDFWTNVAATASTFDTPDRKSMIAQRVLLEECALHQTAYDSGLFMWDLNNLSSPWQYIRTIFTLAPRDTQQNWLDIITRFETIEVPLAGYQQALDQGRQEGVMPAARQVSIAIEQGRSAAGDDSSFNQLIEQFDEVAADQPAWQDLRPRLLAGVDHAKASYGRTTDWLESVLLPVAPTADGVGESIYVDSAQRFLGETIDPHELYAWGWGEFARLSLEVTKTCKRVEPDLSVAEVMDMLATDPSRAAQSVDEFIATMQERQQRALEQLDGTHFEVDDRIRNIEVLTAPTGGSTAPYYTGPSEDFSRPGRVWYPVDGRDQFPLWEEVTTAYHEGFPGHHLQIGWQVAMGDDLSRLHRSLVWYPGSGEGWALYAERCMGELGYLDKPDYEVGLLMSQMFRTCRIVIDIGLHLGLTIPDDSSFHPGETWTYDLGVEMLQTVAHQPEAVAHCEITRYLGWPGQAISYRVGEQAILDLRDEWRAAGHEDLKTFHAELLSVGSIGLDLMRELVRPPA